MDSSPSAKPGTTEEQAAKENAKLTAPVLKAPTFAKITPLALALQHRQPAPPPPPPKRKLTLRDEFMGKLKRFNRKATSTTSPPIGTSHPSHPFLGKQKKLTFHFSEWGSNLYYFREQERLELLELAKEPPPPLFFTTRFISNLPDGESMRSLTHVKATGPSDDWLQAFAELDDKSMFAIIQAMNVADLFGGADKATTRMRLARTAFQVKGYSQLFMIFKNSSGRSAESTDDVPSTLTAALKDFDDAYHTPLGDGVAESVNDCRLGFIRSLCGASTRRVVFGSPCIPKPNAKTPLPAGSNLTFWRGHSPEVVYAFPATPADTSGCPTEVAVAAYRAHNIVFCDKLGKYDHALEYMKCATLVWHPECASRKAGAQLRGIATKEQRALTRFTYRWVLALSPVKTEASPNGEEGDEEKGEADAKYEESDAPVHGRINLWRGYKRNVPSDARLLRAQQELTRRLLDRLPRALHHRVRVEVWDSVPTDCPKLVFQTNDWAT
ncbi:hypothetical protein IAT38_004831 [Cryptococcus sp. DSM 104549]